MIELQDEIEGKCVNNTNFYFDQISESLPIKPSDSDPIFDLQALPSQSLAVRILRRQNQGRYRFRQEPTDEVLREKGEKKKKEEGDIWNVLEFGGMAREKKGGKKVWGQKVLEVSTHSISSPKPTSWRKKCPRTNEGSPDCENVLLRTTLSSAGQNHRRGRRHVARGNPLEDRKRDSKPYGLGIGAW